MKYLLASLLVVVGASISACNQDNNRIVSEPITSEEVKKEPENNRIASDPNNSEQVKKEPETKKVCIKVYDAAQRKEIEKCRATTVREKKEGTPIPK